MQKFILLIVGISVAIVSYIAVGYQEPKIQMVSDTVSRDSKEIGQLDEAIDSNEKIVEIKKLPQHKSNVKEDMPKEPMATPLEKSKQKYVQIVALKKELLLCLNEAEDFRVATACHTKLDEFYRKEMHTMDAPEQMMPKSAPALPEGMWEDSMQDMMTDALEHSIEIEEEILTCVEDASSQAEIEQCSQSVPSREVME